MPANITINQATLGPGVVDTSRTDGVLSQLVTCTNATVETQYTWTLVDTPIRSALVRGSIGTAATFTFTPDVKGTYLVRLQVNSSTSPADNQTLFISVASSGAWTLGWRYEAAQESTQDNTEYAGLGFPADVNPRGWATNRDLRGEQVEEATARVLSAVVTSPGAGTDHLVKIDAATGVIDASLIPPLGGADLQTSYDGGSTISLSDARGAIELDDSAQTAATNIITATKTFAGAGNILDLDIGSSAEGNALRVVHRNFTTNQPAAYFDMDFVASGAYAVEINDTSNDDRTYLGVLGLTLGGGNLAKGISSQTPGLYGDGVLTYFYGMNGGAGDGVTAAGNGGNQEIRAGSGGSATGAGGGAAGALTLRAGTGGADSTLLTGLVGGSAALRGGTGGWAGAGTSVGGGDVTVDGGDDPSGSGQGGRVYLGTDYAREMFSGNFTGTTNVGTPWIHQGDMRLEAPGSAQSTGIAALTLAPQRTTVEGARTYAHLLEFDDTTSAIGGSPMMVLVAGDPNGQVTSGDPGSIAIDPNTGFVYKKTANPSTWADIASGAPPVNVALVHNETLTTASPGPLVVGGGVVDGSISGSYTFRLTGSFTATGTVGDCVLRLYDTGAPGSPIARVLRSTTTIPFASAGSVDAFSVTLTPTGAPGVGVDQIHNVPRVYEVEAEIVGADGATDIFKVLKGDVDIA